MFLSRLLSSYHPAVFCHSSRAAPTVDDTGYVYIMNMCNKVGKEKVYLSLRSRQIKSISICIY